MYNSSEKRKERERTNREILVPWNELVKIEPSKKDDPSELSNKGKENEENVFSEQKPLQYGQLTDRDFFVHL